MAEYTSSPLGLIPEIAFTYNGENSQFSTRNYLRKNIGRTNTTDPSAGQSPLGPNPLSFGSPSEIHTDDVYDIRTSNIVRQLDQYPSMRLKYSDFVYCRDYGVYPNNRLIVCRRFPQPIIDDLTFTGADSTSSDLPEYGSEPISTLISWFDDSKNILEFSFGEEWTDAGVNFKDLLNDVGKDFRMTDGLSLGNVVSSAANVVTLPGSTEGLQRIILEKLGFIEPGNADIIPSGTPNLIKQSKQRSLVAEDQPGSGLKGKFTVSVKCAWEQKFISGVDPTFVYYDILQTILSFGGSAAVFYLGKRSNLGKLDSKLQKLLKPGGAIELVNEIASAFKAAFDKLKDEISKQVSLLIDSSTQDPKDDSKTPEEQQKIQEENTAKQVSEAQGAVGKILDTFVQTIVKKYRVQAIGIVTSLTGLPSTPWHVTLGNPLRPIFSSGDMLCEEVSVNLGPQLSFNDLPSYIEVDFKLTSARNLGIDEIMEKLSCGGIRILREEPTFWNTIGNGTFSTPESITTGTSSQTQDNKEDDASQNITATQSVSDQSKVGNENSTGTASSTGQAVNPDPNSLDPILGKTELPTSNDEEYTVKPGDSIWKIAKNKLGPNASKSEIDAKMKEIIAKNKQKNPAEADGIVKAGQNSDPDFIRPGDKLII
jgi:hypothetical protein